MDKEKEFSIYTPELLLNMPFIFKSSNHKSELQERLLKPGILIGQYPHPVISCELSFDFQPKLWNMTSYKFMIKNNYLD